MQADNGTVLNESAAANTVAAVFLADLNINDPSVCITVCLSPFFLMSAREKVSEDPILRSLHTAYAFPVTYMIA